MLCRRCGICCKNSLRDESGHKRLQCKNHFWHQFKDKLQWLLMKNWLFYPEYSPSKSKHRRHLLWEEKGVFGGYVLPFLSSSCISCRGQLPYYKKRRIVEKYLWTFLLVKQGKINIFIYLTSNTSFCYT